MSSLQGLVLGIVQGLAEFLPISSSAHLVLVPWLLRWPEHSLTYDVALHMGTLAALLVYFWRDWWRLIAAWLPERRSEVRSPAEAAGDELVEGVSDSALSAQHSALSRERLLNRRLGDRPGGGDDTGGADRRALLHPGRGYAALAGDHCPIDDRRRRLARFGRPGGQSSSLAWRRLARCRRWRLA